MAPRSPPRSGAAVGWVFHPFLRRHRTGPDHPERPERLDAILDALERSGLLARLEPLAFGPATFEDLTLVHEPAYVDLLRMACEHGFGFIGEPETRICPESFDAAALAAGGVLAACDAVMEGRVRRAFCAVRPPGHHAEPDRAMGFCLINHVAVAAEHLRRRRGVERVAVVDLDVHHGNGTQRAFEDRDDVLYISIHEHPLTLKYPGTGYPGETGRGPGRGFTLNLCVPHGADLSDYERALRDRVVPALERFRPGFVLVSTGFDAGCTEPVAHGNLTPGDFGRITRELVHAAEALCGGRVVSVLEGGYDLEGLARCAVEHVGALLEHGSDPDA